MRPVGHGPQCRARREYIGLGKHRHQRDESAIAAAVKADPLRDRRHVATPAISPHPPDRRDPCRPCDDRSGAPVAAIAGRAAIIDVNHNKTVLHQEVMEHVFASSSWTTTYARSAGNPRHARRSPPGRSALEVRRLIEARGNLDSVASGERTSGRPSTGSRRIPPMARMVSLSLRRPAGSPSRIARAAYWCTNRHRRSIARRAIVRHGDGQAAR